LLERVSEIPASVAFSRFRALPHCRELPVDGEPVKLGGRAFDVLTALIARRVDGKNALMARVWPDRFVDENNSGDGHKLAKPS
jgi:DNA-binding winged helix-turn-helix (wHTH) protein